MVHFTRKPTELKSINSDEALISWCPDRPSRMSRSCSLSSQVHAMRYALIPFLSVSLRYSIIDGQYWSCNHLYFMVDFSAIPSWLIYLGFHSWPMIIIHSLWCTYLNFNWWLVFFSWSIPKGQLVDGWAIHLKILKLETFPPQIIRGWFKKIKQIWTKPLEPSMFFKNIWTETTFRTLSSLSWKAPGTSIWCFNQGLLQVP